MAYAQNNVEKNLSLALPTSLEIQLGTMIYEQACNHCHFVIRNALTHLAWDYL